MIMAGLSDLVGEAGSLDKPALSGAVGGSSNKELMADARRSLSGCWTMSVLGYLVYSVLIGSLYFFMQAVVLYSGTLGSTQVGLAQLGVSITSLLISGALTVGIYSFFLVIAQDGEVRFEALFKGFKRFLTSFGVYVLSTLLIMLWSILFIIPGIIAVYRYAMVYFIVADEESVGPLEALRQSKMMMAGNKWKLFGLQWRFFGWALLAVFTGGLGFIWLIPYMQTSFAQFYEDVK
jgi:uncharacterized membrane protein